MPACALSQEFIAKERQSVVLEAIEGLETIQAQRRLSPLELAALDALQRAYTRSVTHRGVIGPKEISRPLFVAHRAMEKHA